MKKNGIFVCFIMVILTLPHSLVSQNIDSLLLLRSQGNEPTRVISYPTQPNNGSIWVNREEPYKNYTPEELLLNVFIEDPGCASVSNVVFTGSGWNGSSWTNLDRAMLYFSHGLNLGMESGILLTTGPGLCAEGPNETNSGLGEGVSLGGDADLAPFVAGNITSGAKLEFNFIPRVRNIKFEYIFASEEFPEYAYLGCLYNDGFGFFISGPGIVGNRNIAVFPGTNAGVTIQNIFHTYNQYYIGNEGGIATEYDGYTIPLETATVDVVPGQVYHFKLIIANAGDNGLGSGVFLKSGSLVLSSLENYYYDHPTDTVYGGCTINNFVLNVAPSPIPLLVPLYYSGSCVNDIVQPDGSPMPDFITIPADSFRYELPYKVLTPVTEQGGDITLSFETECGTLQSITLHVYDFGLSINAPTDNFCDQPVIPLTATAQFLNHFIWNTDETTNAIEAYLPGTYSVTAYNDQGCLVDTSIFLIQCHPQLILNGMDYELVDSQVFNQCQWHFLGGFPFGELLPGEHLYWYINGILQPQLTDQKEWDINLPAGHYLIEEKLLSQYNDVFTNSVYLTITIPPIEIVTNPPLDEFCEDESIELTAIFDFDITWNNSSAEKQIVVHEPGTYTVIGHNDSTRCTMEGTIVIPECPFIVILPNAISPGNPDGLNDFLSLPAPERLIEAEIFIYNRAGNLIFHSADKNFIWDGLEDGKIKGYSNYIYVIYYTKTRDSIRLRQQGSIFVY